MRIHRERRCRRGFVLISLYMVVLIFLTLGGALVASALAEMRYAQRSQGSAQAFYLAEAAVDQGYQWLQSQPWPPGGSAPFVINGGWQPLGTNGSFVVTIDPADTNPASYVKRYTVQGLGSSSDGTAALAARQSNLTVQVESFARYAYLTNDEKSSTGSTVWFITADHMRGPTHTNTQFSMNGQPTFDGLVSSVSGSINYYNPPPPGGNNPVFNAGLQLGADPKPYPASIPPTLVNAATAGGSVFNGNTTLSLLSAGTMRVTNAAAGYNNTVLPLPANGVVYVNGGNATLDGVLNGQLTLATTGDVRIAGSVTYNTDPRTDPSSQDLMGILAAGNVVIASTAPADVEVDAAVMALGTSWTVENWWVGPPKGTLTVYGGLNQSKRGPVGTFNGSTGQRVSGYAKDYWYDSRLQNMIPPYFPLTGAFSISGWEDPNN